MQLTDDEVVGVLREQGFGDDAIVEWMRASRVVGVLREQGFGDDAIVEWMRAPRAEQSIHIDLVLRRDTEFDRWVIGGLDRTFDGDAESAIQAAAAYLCSTFGSGYDIRLRIE